MDRIAHSTRGDGAANASSPPRVHCSAALSARPAATVGRRRRRGGQARVVRPVTERGEGGGDARRARGRGRRARDDRDEGDAALAPDGTARGGWGSAPEREPPTVATVASNSARGRCRARARRRTPSRRARVCRRRRRGGRTTAGSRRFPPGACRARRACSRIAIGRRRRSRRARTSGDIADVRAPRKTKRGGRHVGRVCDPSLGPHARVPRRAACERLDSGRPSRRATPRQRHEPGEPKSTAARCA